MTTTATPSPLTLRSANKRSAVAPTPAKQAAITATPLKQSTTATPAQSSPFMSFSPVVASSRVSWKEDNENDESELPSETELENGIVNAGNKAGDLGDDAVSVCSAFSDLEYGLESGSGNAVGAGAGAGAGGAGKEDENGDVVNMSASATRVATPPKASGSVKKSSPLKPSTPSSTRRNVNLTTPRTVPRSTAKTGGLVLSPRRSVTSSPRTPAADDKTTNLLLDFTSQFEAVARPNFGGATPAMHRRTKSASPRKGSLAGKPPPSTPTENKFFNLLDFTPGPVATPNSIPSITPREVEELKAGFNSQVSLLTAQLNGRTVEVDGLRAAVQETEARCAELTNTLKDLNESFDAEREAWDKVKTELSVLFEAEKAEKETISSMLGEKEHVVEELHTQLETKDTEVKNLKKRLRDTEDDLDRTREEVLRLKTEVTSAQTMATSALEAAEAVRAAQSSQSAAPVSVPTSDADAEAAAAKKTQEEVERVARELHILYKAKHETKVAALKKSYETRWEKKVAALQQQVDSLKLRNEELEKRAEEPAKGPANTAAAPATTDEDLKAQLAQLQIDLRNERQEKEGIVSLVEELLAIQQVHQMQFQQQQEKEKKEEKEEKEEKKREKQKGKEKMEEKGAEVAEAKTDVMEKRRTSGAVPPLVASTKTLAPQKRKTSVPSASTATSAAPSASSAGSLRSGIEKMGIAAKRAEMRAAMRKQKEVREKEAAAANADAGRDTDAFVV